MPPGDYRASDTPKGDSNNVRRLIGDADPKAQASDKACEKQPPLRPPGIARMGRLKPGEDRQDAHERAGKRQSVVVGDARQEFPRERKQDAQSHGDKGAGHPAEPPGDKERPDNNQKPLKEGIGDQGGPLKRCAERA